MPTPEALQLAEEVFYMDTPEEVALALDRFAAQRGAVITDRAGDYEAQAQVGAPPQTGGVDCPRAKSDMTPCVLRDGELAADDRGCCVGCGERIGPQTGGGDAGERARAVVTNWYDSGPYVEELTQDVAAALRSSHQEGAEAMREADARACSERGAWAESKIADDKDGLWANYSNACDDCAEIVSALPIPGKTDAG